MAYVQIDKNFDVRTLEVLIKGIDEEIEVLVKRNVTRFHDEHLVDAAENLDVLKLQTNEYEEQLRQKIDTTMKRLASTDNGLNLTEKEARKIFEKTLNAVEDAIQEIEIEKLFADELQYVLSDEYTCNKNESITHFNMFMKQYHGELNTNTDNYLKKYITTMIKHSFIFDKDGEQYSLLVFLSFYEAYMQRIIGLTVLSSVKSGNIHSEEIMQYAENITAPLVKSCYFTKMQKWFKGEISEFIERFLMVQVDEKHRIDYQKNTLIDKKMLKQGKCDSVVEPPIIIPTPSLVNQFFLCVILTT